MGDDIPIAALGRTPRRVYGYLRQRFAQVTNPAIDPLREKAVMSLRVRIGPRRGTLEPEGGADRELRRSHHPAIPGTQRLLELESPVLGAAELARVLEDATVLDATYALGESLHDALRRLCREASETPGVIVLSDRRAGLERIAIPMALAVGAVHEALLKTGERMAKDLVAIAGDVVDVHDVACLVTIGATAVHPYLALATAAAAASEGETRYRKALEAALLKVMAKMGISCVDGYRGSQVLEALGLGAEVMELCFPAVPSNIGGVDLTDIERMALPRLVEAPALPDHGRVRFRKAGEHHAYNPLAVRAAQKAARENDHDAYLEWRRLSSMGEPQSLRELLHIKTARQAIPLESVEPSEAIVKRFVSTAMSLGALSPEAHEALAIAMNQIGARSNSGEGGEDPATYSDDDGGRRDNRVKQVASARFGVTPRYLKRADELEIKIAQGSKPGEGGQLPGLKVTSLIARLRHAQPGMQLISPPPHHDIYSIEDLAQLIHDLKTVNPGARIGVKLVSEAGFGTGVLVALGCDMARQCHLNTCPTGIATQNEELRAKFEGRPEHVVNYLFLIAEEVREHLAKLGARTLDEIVGRVELLEQDEQSKLDLSYVLATTDVTVARRRQWERNGDAPTAAPPEGEIDNSQRTTGANLSRGERRRYRGSAGQSFGAFLDEDVELTLEGQAQDYVGKGMCGGVIAIQPFAEDAADEPVLAGNTIAYGATGGRLFIAGRGGGRFCVRSSGAVAAVSGAGVHFCEYMTGAVAGAQGA